MTLTDRARKVYREALALYEAGLPSSGEQTMLPGSWTSPRCHMWRDLPELQKDIEDWIEAERLFGSPFGALPDGKDMRAWLNERDAA